MTNRRSDYLDVSPRIRIPLRELRFTFARSPGPGGQNVNKVNSKAILNWTWEASPSLSDDIKARLRVSAAGRISKDGEFIVSSSRFRDQRQNIDDCLEKLAALIRAAEFPPKRRRATRKTRGSVLRRLSHKRQRSQVKQERRGPRGDD